MDIQNVQQEAPIVKPLPADVPAATIKPPESTNKFIQRMTTPSNKFIAALQKVIPGKTIELSKTPEMISEETHPVAHEIKDRERFNRAVRVVESTDNYSTIRKGNGAMGAYQVMPHMLPLFTKKYFGKEISKKEFISNPKIQDELFNKFMDEYVPKEGLRNATARWFLGKNYDYAMGNNESGKILRDGNGLTAEDYWKKVESQYKD